MKLTVLGLWHLGCVTAACSAEKFTVRGLDFDEITVAKLAQGIPPIHEPGLIGLIKSGLDRGTLSFTTEASLACADADVLWACHDTPVDEDDRADVDFVLDRIRRCLAHLRSGAVVLISSQLPAGTCARLQKEFPQFSFACSPENLRLGQAIDAFRKAERIIVGVRDDKTKDCLAPLLGAFCSNLIFMSPESAEMTKHALNGFLALSVSYANEIARVCERVGADARQVEAGLKSDVRIGPRAYLSPGPAFAGGTLARDVATLTDLGRQYGEELVLIPSIKTSNDRHKGWALAQLHRHLGSLSGKTVAVLGLTYKPQTSTLRRSSSVELCRQLISAGAVVRTFDPGATEIDLAQALRELDQPLTLSLSPALSGGEGARRAGEGAAHRFDMTFEQSAINAMTGADAVVIGTPWPEFRQIDWPKALESLGKAVIIDAHGFVRAQVSQLPGVTYQTVGSLS